LSAPVLLRTYDLNLKTDRIISQRGVFTFSYYLFTDHAYEFGKLHGKKEYLLPLVKIIIPTNLKQKIRQKLSKMNISNENLFPGIDGVGKTITEKIELYQDVFRMGLLS
jgi:hypothetical protein